jgi:phospholipase C
MPMVRRLTLLAALALCLGAVVSVPTAGAERGLNPLLIKHTVVIYEENHSFDDLWIVSASCR